MPEDISKTFGRVVRTHREAQGISQEAFASIAGIHRTYVSSIELGKVRVGLDIAKKVADALGVALSALLVEAESADPPHLERPERKRAK